MSVYLIKGKGKGWRYDFTLKGLRYTGTWFKTKTKAKQAEAKRREELINPQEDQKPQIDMVFLDLVNLRLDHVKAFNSDWHYRTYVYLARRWIVKWGYMHCDQITNHQIQNHLIDRRKISAFTANKDLRYLRATFNFGIKKKLTKCNPTDGIEFFPIERTIKYIPPVENINKVLEVAVPDVQDYLWAIRDTFARVGEINRLMWDDVNLQEKYIILYTRKKRHGHLTPRKVAMTKRLYTILSRRYAERQKKIPWVFWHGYIDPSNGKKIIGPFKYRRTILRTLCKKAGVKYFGFHALRHSGASLMDRNNVPIGSIQRILGHENRQTTEIYLHSIDQTERDAIAIYENAIEKSHTSLTQRANEDNFKEKKGSTTTLKNSG